MAKLTKVQIKDIERTLDAAKKVLNFIHKDSTIVCTKDFNGKPYSTSHYYNEDKNLCISPSDKYHGSHLAQLPDIITNLESFLERNTK